MRKNNRRTKRASEFSANIRIERTHWGRISDSNLSRVVQVHGFRLGTYLFVSNNPFPILDTLNKEAQHEQIQDHTRVFLGAFFLHFCITYIYIHTQYKGAHELNCQYHNGTGEHVYFLEQRYV